MKTFSVFALVLFNFVYGHGGHSHDGVAEGETVQQYAQRHMAKEHHIDDFDVASFFQLHDLNRDGKWDREEIEAVYGVHHPHSQKKSKDEEEHQKKADHIVNTVLEALDKDKDGKITVDELEAVGLDGLPNFDNMGAEGHHYDVESEFFLHHEEEYHSTPETQTDESYNHPEDIEHFAQHEAIERKEAEKEAKFQGISVEEALAQHEAHDAPAGSPQVTNQDGAQQPLVNPNEVHNDQAQPSSQPGDPNVPTPNKKFNRVTPPEQQDPHSRFNDAKAASSKQAEWGAGDDGYKAPKAPADRMRKNLPYKYKFRRNWGDF